MSKEEQIVSGIKINGVDITGTVYKVNKILSYDEPSATTSKDGGGINSNNSVGVIDTFSKVWEAPTGSLTLLFTGASQLIVRDLAANFIKYVKQTLSFARIENLSYPGWFRYGKFTNVANWQITKDGNGTFFGEYVFNIQYKDPYLYRTELTTYTGGWRSWVSGVNNWIYGYQNFVTSEALGYYPFVDLREFEIQVKIKPKVEGATLQTLGINAQYLRFYIMKNVTTSASASPFGNNVVTFFELYSETKGQFKMNSESQILRYAASDLDSNYDNMQTMAPKLSASYPHTTYDSTDLQFFSLGNLFSLGDELTGNIFYLGIAYKEDVYSEATPVLNNVQLQINFRYRGMKLG